MKEVAGPGEVFVCQDCGKTNRERFENSLAIDERGLVCNGTAVPEK